MFDGVLKNKQYIRKINETHVMRRFQITFVTNN